MPPSWEGLRDLRWGPAVSDPTPGIDLPARCWRWEVANWSVARWGLWRRLTADILGAGRAPAEQIRAAEHQAYLELRDPDLPFEERFPTIAAPAGGAS